MNVNGYPVRAALAGVSLLLVGSQVACGPGERGGDEEQSGVEIVPITATQRANFDKAAKGVAASALAVYVQVSTDARCNQPATSRLECTTRADEQGLVFSQTDHAPIAPGKRGQHHTSLKVMQYPGADGMNMEVKFGASSYEITKDVEPNRPEEYDLQSLTDGTVKLVNSAVIEPVPVNIASFRRFVKHPGTRLESVATGFGVGRVQSMVIEDETGRAGVARIYPEFYPLTPEPPEQVPHEVAQQLAQVGGDLPDRE